jgi:hypothetical protein
MGRAGAALAHCAAEQIDDLCREAGADVGGDEHLFEFIEEIIGHLAGAREEIRYATEEVAEQVD